MKISEIAIGEDYYSNYWPHGRCVVVDLLKDKKGYVQVERFHFDGGMSAGLALVTCRSIECKWSKKIARFEARKNAFDEARNADRLNHNLWLTLNESKVAAIFQMFNDLKLHEPQPRFATSNLAYYLRSREEMVIRSREEQLSRFQKLDTLDEMKNISGSLLNQQDDPDGDFLGTFQFSYLEIALIAQTIDSLRSRVTELTLEKIADQWGQS